MTSLFAPKPQPLPAAPAVTPPAPMPDQNSASAIEANRKAQMDIMGRAGRTSTILTAPNQRGGNTDYTAKSLGSVA